MMSRVSAVRSLARSTLSTASRGTRGYATEASDKLKLSLTLPHEVSLAVVHDTECYPVVCRCILY